METIRETTINIKDLQIYGGRLWMECRNGYSNHLQRPVGFYLSLTAARQLIRDLSKLADEMEAQLIEQAGLKE